MRSCHSKLIPLLLGSLLIAGCKTLPVVPHALDCEVSPELLASKCATPRQVSDDATYAELVDTMQADRKALRDCNIIADSLRETIRRCSHATDDYNQKIDALNRGK